jgi:hypothetical protein
MASSPALKSSIKLIGQFLVEFLYFPLWWYSVGFFRCLKHLASFLRGWSESLGVLVWVKNIFRPMYGQRDFASHVISFFMRSVQVVARSIAWTFWFLVALLAAAFWLLLPIVVAYNIWLQI